MNPGFGIYVHWPFCRSKCPYCDFNSHVRDRIDHGRWREALLGELAHFARLTQDRVVTSLFFGGGTPSLMEVETVGALIEAVGRHWALSPELEVTLEANPNSAEAAKFKGFRECGVNRLSLGVQSLDDEALRFLGRRHDGGQAIAALDLAKKIFPRVSFDLIYARPGQETSDWARELDAALLHAADHLSLYQLTIEPGTQFEQSHARGDFSMPEESLAADLHECTIARLGEAGLVDYEISNFAREGAESRHNLVYWRYGDYVGVGPGAHGRLALENGRIATRQHRAPEIWLDMVEAAGHASRGHTSVTPRQALEEMLMMGLRLREGVSLDRVISVTGRTLPEWILQSKIDPLINGGFLELDDTCLRSTDRGRRVLDALLPRLLA